MTIIEQIPRLHSQKPDFCLKSSCSYSRSSYNGKHVLEIRTRKGHFMDDLTGATPVLHDVLFLRIFIIAIIIVGLFWLLRLWRKLRTSRH